MNPNQANRIFAEIPTELPGVLLEQQASKGSRLIAKILSPAIQLWLRAQVESISELMFQIQGSDQDILRGCIPNTEVQAEKIVYRGLHLSHVHLTASQIQINLRQVMQGKPLRLLEAVPVVGTVKLNQSDLDAATNAPLLKQALADFLTLALNHINVALTSKLALQHQSIQLEHPQVQLATDCLKLTTDVLTPLQQRHPLTLQTKVRLDGGSLLQFSELALHCPSLQEILDPEPLATEPLVIDLGAEVRLDKLEITPEGILCQGRISVMSV